MIQIIYWSWVWHSVYK